MKSRRSNASDHRMHRSDHCWPIAYKN